MNLIGNDIFTASAILVPTATMLWYFFRRWMERMDRLESKLDAISNLVPRSECNASLVRIHHRIDEVVAGQMELSDRVARLEAKAE